MELLRTPDERFDNLPGYDFAPNYTTVDDVRIHYVDEGPRDGQVVLMLHGEPSWSYLYRKMIPVVVAAGHRAIAPDLVGFGRSDKPSKMDDYTYDRHIAWMRGLLDNLELKDITLFCQDWGGLIGLRLVAAQPERFARVVAANTFLPTGREPVSKAFKEWREFSQTSDKFDVGPIIQKATITELSDAEVAAYDAPFPDDSYKAGARIFPSLVPIEADIPDAKANQAAWANLSAYTNPFLTLFGDSDPITRGADKFLRAAIKGAKDQPHATIEAAHHFLQEDEGALIATKMVDFMAAT